MQIASQEWFTEHNTPHTACCVKKKKNKKKSEDYQSELGDTDFGSRLFPQGVDPKQEVAVAVFSPPALS